MAEVSLKIGGRNHIVACREGEEPRLRTLGARLDAQWADAARASGGMSNERTMLFVALMLADSLDEAERRPQSGFTESQALTGVAEWLEELADALEKRGANA